jgi:hypothetical protein
MHVFTFGKSKHPDIALRRLREHLASSTPTPVTPSREARSAD